MRTTRDFALLSAWSDIAPQLDLISAERLAVARCEGVFRAYLGVSALDLVFADGERRAVVPNVLVEGFPVLTRSGPALIWPAAVAAVLAEDVAAAIEERLLPWLRTLTLGRSMAGEHLRRYRPLPAFERARALGLCGAAPFAQTLVRMAPFAYARRFAVRSRVRFACADAALGAAMLRDRAASIALDVPGSDDERFAADWYGVRAGANDAPPQVEVVDRESQRSGAPVAIVLADESAADGRRIVVPQPVAHDVIFTFDDADAPEVRRFVVHAQETVGRPGRDDTPPAASAASTGRIVFWLPPDAEYGADARVDEAHALARLLRAEGLSVEVTARFDAARPAGADLVQLYGDLDAETAQRAAGLRAGGIAYALALAPPAEHTVWAEELLALCVQLRSDDASLERDLVRYRDRSITTHDYEPYLSDTAAEARWNVMAEAVGGAAVVFSALPEETERLRARYPHVPPERFIATGVAIAPEPPEDPIGDVVGPQPFVLIHAPALKRANVLFAVAAAARAGVPAVVAGSAGDVYYAAVLRRIAGPDTIFLADPPEGMLAALYRRAAVVVDAGVRPSGLGRIMRGTLCGALPVVAREWPLAEEIRDAELLFDPLSLDDAARAIRAALERPDRAVATRAIAARLRPRCDSRTVLRAVLGGYARASGAAV